MAKQRYVNTFFWDDSYVEDLNPNAKLLFIYLITSPLTNIAGSFEISFKKICDHTGLSRSKAEEILAKFEADGKVIYKNNWMLVVNAIEHQDCDNKNIRKGIETIISTSPKWVIDRVSIAYIWLAHLKNSLSHLNSNLNSNSNSNADNGLDQSLYISHTISDVKKELGVEKFNHSQEREWVNEISLAFTNRVPRSDFVECFSLLRQQRGYAIKPAWVTDNLPEIDKLRKKQPKVAAKPNRPTGRELAAEADRQERELLAQ